LCLAQNFILAQKLKILEIRLHRFSSYKCINNLGMQSKCSIVACCGGHGGSEFIGMSAAE